MKLNRTEEIRGYFVPFTEIEEQEINELLQSEGFELSGTGLKNFVLSCIEEEEEEEGPQNARESTATRVNEYLNQHPELVNMMRFAGNAGVQAIKKKIGI